MAKKLQPISMVVRGALERSGQTPAEVSRETGIPESVLSRFRAGAYLRGANLDALAAHLGVEAVKRRSGSGRKRGVR